MCPKLVSDPNLPVKNSILSKSPITAAVGFISALLFAIYLFFSPELPGLPLYSSYNQQRFFGLLLLAVICGLTLACTATRAEWLRCYFFLSGRTRMLLFALLLLGVWSGVRAVYPWFALLEVAHFALIFMAVISVATIRVNLGPLFDWLPAIILAGIGWVYLLDFVGYYSVVVGYGFDLKLVQDQVLSKFANVRFFGQWQSWTLPLMVLPLLLVGRSWPWYLALLFLLPAAGWWLLLFISGTRGATLGSAVALVLTVLVYRRRALPWLRWHMLAAASGLAAYLSFYYLLPRLLNLEAAGAVAQGVIHRSTGGISGRQYLWSSAWEMISSHPLLGVGPMHYADDGHWIAAHPHSAPLQIAAEWGLPALAIVLLLFVYGLVVWLRDDPGWHQPSVQREAASLRPALFAALIAASFHSLFSGIIVMPVSQVMMVLVLGWMMGIAYREPAGREYDRLDYSPSRRAQLLLLLFAALVLAGIAKPLADQLPNLKQANQRYYVKESEVKSTFFYYYRPRFWQQGYLAPHYPVGAATDDYRDRFL